MNNSDLQNAFNGTATAIRLLSAFQGSLAAYARYANTFTVPLIIAANYFNRVECQRFWTRTPVENLQAYFKLGTMNLDIAGRALISGMQVIDQFWESELQRALSALKQADPQFLEGYLQRIALLLDSVTFKFPAAVRNIESEFGFHFERQSDSIKIDETERFLLYQVLPDDKNAVVRKNGKPVLIVPPFVLGANILCFLPGEKRSYAHAFANQGIPTYIRILKDIQTCEAVQGMTPEQDARDTRRFCEAIKARHGLPVTLNGYCQGGYTSLCNILSGELDGLVDALITCVSPMDGTRSKGLSKFLQALPKPFNDLAYGAKQLPNGAWVADGLLMGWIYKLKSIETEAPLLAMWRDMMLASRANGGPISKTAAAINYWLTYERNDLALEVTRMSFESYNTPITTEGLLPVKLFGRLLDIKRITARNIRWLICYGLQDDLVEPPTALAPLDHVQAEVTAYPTGHVAIATSWSHPESVYALHLRYENGKFRGPVRYQLDLQEEIDTRRLKAAKKRKRPAR